MSGKGRKSRRRQSTHQHKATPMIQEIDEDKISCLFCGKTDAQIEQSIFNGKLPEGSYSQWAECSSCEQWMHVECVDGQIGLDGTVSGPLWKKICNLAEWDFTCPACGEYRPIPAQLEFQNVFSRQELLAMNIPEHYLLKRMSRDPSPVPTGDEIKDFEPDMEQATSPTTQLSSGDIVAATPEASGGGGDLAVPGMAQAPVGVPGGPMAPGINQIPVGMPSGAFDMGPMMQIMNFMREQMTQQSLVQQQQQQAFMNKFFEDREKKDALDRQERERIRLEESVRWERMFKSSASSVAASAPIGRDTSKPATLRLPKVQLPQFDGSVLKWPEFWDLFENMVHNNQDLPKIQKLSFLKQTLTGSAAAIIASYKITENNYDAVIKKLKERYDKKPVIKEQLYNQLQNLPVSGQKGTELRKTFDAIASICTQLENVGEDVNNQFVLHTIRQKFPVQVQQKLEEKKPKATPWSFELFWQYLEDYIEVLEKMWMTRDFASAPRWTPKDASMPSRPIGQQSQAQSSVRPPMYSPPTLEFEERCGGTAGSLVAGQSQKQTWSCAFCDSKEHYSAYCPTVTSFEDRVRIMKESNRCFLCLKPGHQKWECKHKNRDRYCPGCGKKGQHHLAVCIEWVQKTFPPRPPIRPSAPQPDNNQTITTGNSAMAQISETSNPAIAVEPRSLPPMFTAVVQEHTRPARILLDTACNRTWISEEFAKQLCVKYGEPRDVLVNTFGSIEPQSYKSSRVNISLRANDTNGWGRKIGSTTVCLSAWTKPGKLAQPIQRFMLPQKDQRHLREWYKHLILAKDTIPKDTSESLSFQPDIIIGSDNYYEIHPESATMITLPSGLKLNHTRLGHVLCGRSLDPTTHPEPVFHAEANIAAIAVNSDTAQKQESGKIKPKSASIEASIQKVSKRKRKNCYKNVTKIAVQEHKNSVYSNAAKAQQSKAVEAKKATQNSTAQYSAVTGMCVIRANNSFHFPGGGRPHPANSAKIQNQKTEEGFASIDAINPSPVSINPSQVRWKIRNPIAIANWRENATLGMGNSVRSTHPQWRPPDGPLKKSTPRSEGCGKAESWESNEDRK